MPKIYRLFIDPASISTGWAYFENDVLLLSGTIRAENPKAPIFERLWEIFNQYRSRFIARRIDEVHLEQWGGRPSHLLHWSVGCIGMALYSQCARITQDVPVSSWQAFTDWKGNRGILAPYVDKVKSEDELAAIGMGMWYVNKIYGDVR